MKRLAGVIITVLILYVVYYDLSQGTLPTIKEQPTEAKQVQQKEDGPYFKKRVQPGDTVLSIVESQLDDSLPVPIDNVVEDFQSLNNGKKPEEIQIGKSYKFPDYNSQ